MTWFATRRYYDIRFAATLLIVVANTILFAFCAHDAGLMAIAPHLLTAKGALTPASAQPGQYWHLIAYGFLHANAMHLGMNVLSLALCGPFLERRLGSSTFAVVFLAAVVGGGLASVATHAGPFATVGASGGILGIIGALFALWILGAKDLSIGFFLVNVGVNLVFAAGNPTVDLAVHVGGFVAGMASIALLDLLAKINSAWLRCKFPEFAKLNVVILASLGGLYLYLSSPMGLTIMGRPVASAVVWLLAVVVMVKGIDLLLALRHGLIGVVGFFAACNGLSSLVLGTMFHRSFQTYCHPGPFQTDWMNEIVPLVCVDPTAVTDAVACCIVALTLVFYVYPLQRGFRDVGFVGATFTAERRRQRLRGAL